MTKKYLLAFLVLLSGAMMSRAVLWIEDFDEGMKQAKETGKYALVDFSGSDWCGWCKRLDKEVFSQDVFAQFADENLVLILVDFPRSKPQGPKVRAYNQSLMDKFGVEGFPTVLLFTPEGELAAKTGYEPGGPEKYVKHLRGLIEKDKAARQPKSE